jgi:hypothetical protein
MRVGVSDSSRPGDTPRGKNLLLLLLLPQSDSFSSLSTFVASFFFGFCGQKESLENTQTEIKIYFCYARQAKLKASESMGRHPRRAVIVYVLC